MILNSLIRTIPSFNSFGVFNKGNSMLISNVISNSTLVLLLNIHYKKEKNHMQALSIIFKHLELCSDWYMSQWGSSFCLVVNYFYDNIDRFSSKELKLIKKNILRFDMYEEFVKNIKRHYTNLKKLIKINKIESDYLPISLYPKNSLARNFAYHENAFLEQFLNDCNDTIKKENFTINYSNNISSYKKVSFYDKFFPKWFNKVLQRHYGIHIVEEKLAFKHFNKSMTMITNSLIYKIELTIQKRSKQEILKKVSGKNEKDDIKFL